jgi:hypothetical protein
MLSPPVCLHALDPHALAPGPREEPDPDGEADPQDADAYEEDPIPNIVSKAHLQTVDPLAARSCRTTMIDAAGR